MCRARGGHRKSFAPFISTNDCLVSAFANALRPTMCMMAANFRGKVTGLDADDAGNYEDLIEYYDFSKTNDENPDAQLTCDYANPALIRRSVQGAPYARAVTTATLSNADFLFRVGRIGVTTGRLSRSRWTCSRARRRFCTCPFRTGRKPTRRACWGACWCSGRTQEGSR